MAPGKQLAVHGSPFDVWRLAVLLVLVLDLGGASVARMGPTGLMGGEPRTVNREL